MKQQAFQPGELRDEHDNIIRAGAYGKKTPFVNSDNSAILDYIMNNFDALYAQIPNGRAYVKSVNNITPDSNGNVTVNVGSGGGTGGTNITVDSTLSSTSTNPVQNKVIYAALNNKLGKNDTAVNASKVNNLTVETAVPKNAKFTDTVYTHPSTHPASMITGLASVATSGSYSDLSNKPTIPVVPTKVSAFINDAGYLTQHQSLDDYAKKTDIPNVTVDTALSATSTNPVQNKVIKEALDDKLGKNETAAAAIKDGAGNTISTTYASKADVSASLSTKLGVNSTAYAATRDGAGNIIVDTYAKKTDISGMVKSVNGTAPDSAGNVTINVSGGGSSVTVDTELSGTSNNAIANKAVYNALLNKAGTDIFSGFMLSSPTAIIAWRQGSQPAGSIDATNYTGTAARATQDGAGNVITDTYAKKTDISGVVKSVNGVQPDTNGNVSITVSGGSGVSTSTENTWTAQQNFQKMKFNFESYNAPRISGTIDNPSSSVAVYNVQGNFTLDMSVLAGLLSNSDATLFTAYITANGAYTLSITNAGTLKYVGNASDLAITINGLLLNILLIKSSSGDLSSVVQASALS